MNPQDECVGRAAQYLSRCQTDTVLVWPAHMATNAFVLFLLCALFLLYWNENRGGESGDSPNSE